MQLAHAPGDQLRVLAAEVQDDDGVRLAPAALAARNGAAGAVDVGALRRPGVQGHLQVRLHLGVVRGEDAVARVGKLAVDGLAAPAGGPLVVVGARLGVAGWRPAIARRHLLDWGAVVLCASPIRLLLRRVAQSPAPPSLGSLREQGRGPQCTGAPMPGAGSGRGASVLGTGGRG